MRGEHETETFEVILDGGSSPHARGTRSGCRAASRRRRFIPACAGNTSRGRRRRSIRSVHPRMRGEHESPEGRKHTAIGSSPHARGTLTAISSRRLRTSVHPRMRGEHATRNRRSGAPIGSSPHARGTPSIPLRATPANRFIPACAGNTTRRSCSRRSATVHPRMRGEHGLSRPRPISSCGSSPHARGTRCRPRSGPAAGRFIPACAGNTARSQSSACAVAVHPRMRGQHPLDGPLVARMIGSSPHARGTRGDVRRHQSCVRFIPACAGNTRRSSTAETRPTVHPRMRGEHRLCASDASCLHGSSPHARGTRRANLLHAAKRRFIPACAGNTRFRHTRSLCRSVHPRMRGEHGASPAAYNCTTGSSPHARGTLELVDQDDAHARFIPACAGNTPSRRASRSRSAVHPRMRGEHPDRRRIPRALPGSSPHARGTRADTQARAALPRFIPACAGNTG